MVFPIYPRFTLLAWVVDVDFRNKKYVTYWMHTTRLDQWLSWVFATQEKKQEIYSFLEGCPGMTNFVWIVADWNPRLHNFKHQNMPIVRAGACRHGYKEVKY